MPFKIVGVDENSDFPPRVETRLANDFAAMGHTHTAADLPTATDAGKGVVELATNAETLTGTDETRSVTPASLKYTLDDNINPSVAALSTLTASGRLSQAQLDERYQINPSNQHAVFIGSSNAQAGWGWTQTLSTKRGWIHHNYAVGGAGFMPLEGVGNFKAQATSAINDNSFPKADVAYVFVVDMSNDIRGLQNVESAASAVFTQLRGAYPNARIILVPAVYTFVTQNTNDWQKLAGVRARYNEARRAGINYGVEAIPDSWLWFWDSGNWLQGVEPNFHLNSAGYTKLVDYIERYLDGKDIDNSIGYVQATNIISVGTAGVTSLVARSRGVVTVMFDMTTYGSIAIDTDLCKLPDGCGPIKTNTFALTGYNREVDYSAYIFTDGTIRSMTTFPGAQTFSGIATYLAL